MTIKTHMLLCNHSSAGTDQRSVFVPIISHFAGTVNLPESQSEKRSIIEKFWISVLDTLLYDTALSMAKDAGIENLSLEDKLNLIDYDGRTIRSFKSNFVNSYHEPDGLVDYDTRTIKVPKSQFLKSYKDTIYTLLDEHRGVEDVKVLEDLQRKIEDLTLNFSEESMYKSCPNIMKMMTKTDLPNAKEFLRGEYLMDKDLSGRMRVYEPNSLKMDSLSVEEKKKCNPVLSDADKALLKEFGEHTLECLLVHTLSHLFNMENYVSLASLIDRIESNVRQHALFLRNNRVCKNEDEKVLPVGSKAKTIAYPFGTALVEFLESRGLLRFTQHHNDEIITGESSDSIPQTFVKRVTKKKNSFYRSSFNYAQCNFNTALLPIKLNLPMVFPPKDWEVNLPESGRMWLNISDTYGGYLSNPTGLIYGSPRTMSSTDKKSFFIYFGLNSDKESNLKAGELCTAISSLQRTAFKINSQFLTIINNNRLLLEDQGFLMPEFLTRVIVPKACGILRTIFDRVENKDIQSLYSYSELVTILMKNIQRARYECTIIDLAKAYDGYSLYFPAFLDFRGRIYRCGIFHFHERDFARSLLLLDIKDKVEPPYVGSNENKLEERYLIATSFLYESHRNEAEALADARQMLDSTIKLADGSIPEDTNQRWYYFYIITALRAYNSKRPFQFMSNILLFLECYIDSNKTRDHLYKTVPITQDASASAYQLMGYFLLDEGWACKTNLFETNGYINDIYSYIRVDLIQYIKDSLTKENPELCAILDRIITRSIVKKIFMPIIYGKTINSTTKDLILSLSQDVLPQECAKLSALCFKFWKDRYSSMESFIELIRLVGRVCASLERPVLYSTPYFNTSQDYKKMESCSVRVFDSKEKRRRSVTLSFPSNVRDKKKSRASTFVNFIHQKDAQIAMSVAIATNEFGLPLYTVHDNFISNTKSCQHMSMFYLKAIKDMGPPLTIINRFIYMNLIEPAIENGDLKKRYYLRPGFYDDKIIPTSILDEFLNIGGTPLSEAKNKAGWKKITEQLKNRYSLYCKAVCGPDKSFESHMSKWKTFSSRLKGLYCIHH